MTVLRIVSATADPAVVADPWGDARALTEHEPVDSVPWGCETRPIEPTPSTHPDSTVRRAQRVLSMVGELHKVGYQRLRVAPGMAPSGLYWRCLITPADNILESHGALIAGDDDDLVVFYGSGQENEYFGWTDAKSANARQLARLFVQRFQTIADRAVGQDWEYAGWFVQMLGVAESGHLPIAYSDWDDPNAVTGVPTTWKEGVPGPVLPLPPPGLAAHRG